LQTYQTATQYVAKNRYFKNYKTAFNWWKSHFFYLAQKTSASEN